MGGYQTVYTGFVHPDEFSALGIFSAGLLGEPEPLLGRKASACTLRNALLTSKPRDAGLLLYKLGDVFLVDDINTSVDHRWDFLSLHQIVQHIDAFNSHRIRTLPDQRVDITLL